ncbi:putative DNA-binding transcriptional regulator YafY [Microbacterium sp. W4I4]|uniref:helix-turn-helix transcriptional regulator n=1 Tax=Microbacterium sp. W4I4 TaxID=3042295 RepID=UPI00278630B4|nr:YafY family protein [Microbacterium sp. W4I4]MDQ0614357.1 putative DNA-binding transcriptional regulator YafY [Microbacterium sp. W4I4]
MTRTTGRTLALLALLQVRREWSGAELRERLEVSDRTLRRDIDDLRELGYGVEATRGRHGGYRLGVGAEVPPLTLAPDESVAIAVGLRAAATSVVTGMEDASARALAKLEQSLSPSTRRQIVEVEQAMVPLVRAGQDIDFEVVTALAAAIASRRRLRVDYTRHDGAEIQRVVEAHRIVHTAERWYLVAWDIEREAWRTLRVDRLRRPVQLREEFGLRDIPDDALRRFTTHSITTAPYPIRARVRMHAPAAEVSQHFDATIAQVVDDVAGTSILTAGARTPEEFALYIGMSGIEFEVLEGEEVRRALGEMGERMLRGRGSEETSSRHRG